jgi:plasmid stability protein
MAALQVRDIPDDIHDTLRLRAAAAGQSLSEYALGILRSSTEKPTLAEFRERIRRRGPIGTATTEDVVALIRADRDGR